MREDHQNLQTPKKELMLSSNRKAKPINAKSKKLHQKSSKKSLSSVFAPISEDAKLPEKSSIELISATSEVCDDDQSTAVQGAKRSLNCELIPVKENVTSLVQGGEDQNSESTEGCFMSLNQTVSSSSATPGAFEMTPSSSSSATPGVFEMTPSSSLSQAEMTPLSCISTSEMFPSSSTPAIGKAELIDALVTRYGAVTLDADEENSPKSQPLAKHLRQYLIQIFSSADIDPRHKKLLDELMKIVIEEFSGLHTKKGWLVEFFLPKVKLIFLTFALLILAVSAVFIFSPGSESSFHGPPPT